MSIDSNNNVLVTGFGPFGEHQVNASWEAVKLLPPEVDGHNIIKELIPVAYDAVDTKIPSLWKQHNPKLVIHVGVSRFANKLTLESCAFKEGYLHQDCYNNLPCQGNQCAAKCDENSIKVGIDVAKICDHLNENNIIAACVSETAGRYLCEYTLYTSLSINRNRAIFIHVPPLEKPYSDQELAKGIIEVIKFIVEQEGFHSN